MYGNSLQSPDYWSPVHSPDTSVQPVICQLKSQVNYEFMIYVIFFKVSMHALLAINFNIIII